MGNKPSPQGLERLLISNEQFKYLTVGDKIDHRDYEGRYLPARIVQKSGYKVKVHYIGWNKKYDKTVNYKSSAADFAQHETISKLPACGPLSGFKMGDPVKFRPAPNESSCPWVNAIIVRLDDKYNSGQVQVQYQIQQGKVRQRWTHLDNQYEILPQQNNSNNRNNGNKKGKNKYNQDLDNNHHNCSGHGHSHDHGNYNNNQHQQYQQVQVKKQDQMTARTQLLLDDTVRQCKLIGDYLDGINDNKSKDEITQFNQLVVAGLTLFDMKINGMRKNAKKENLNFTDAFKSSAMIVKQFEEDCKSKFGHNEFLMQRLEPCLNYMRAVLYGHDVPQLPYINNYEFNQKIAGNVISEVASTQNHVIPARMKEVNDNKDKYKKNQKKLAREYESGGYNDKISKVNVGHLMQDYNTNNIAYGKSKQEQNKIINKQMNEYIYQQPDLLNGDGNDGNRMDQDQDHEYY